MGDVITTSYNTLWSIVFVLDPVKKVNNEIWIVQDDSAPRRSILYMMELKDRFIKRPSIFDSMSSGILQASIVKSTDFIGFIGGLIFVLSTVFQFLVNKINDKSAKKEDKPIQIDQIQMQQIGQVY